MQAIVADASQARRHFRTLEAPLEDRGELLAHGHAQRIIVVVRHDLLLLFVDALHAIEMLALCLLLVLVVAVAAERLQQLWID